MKTLANLRILVLEDEAIVAMMIEDMLIELGVTVVGPASTINEALALVAQQRCDAALLDIHVAGQSSEPVALALRAHNVPVVFATGYSAHPLLNFPDAAFLQKPYPIEALEAALLAICPGVRP